MLHLPKGLLCALVCLPSRARFTARSVPSRCYTRSFAVAPLPVADGSAVTNNPAQRLYARLPVCAFPCSNAELSAPLRPIRYPNCHRCADPGPGRPRPGDGGKRQRCRCYDAQVCGRIAPDPAAYVTSYKGRKRGRPNAEAREGTNR